METATPTKKSAISNQRAKELILAKIDEAIEQSENNYIAEEIGFWVNHKELNREQRRSDQGVNSLKQMEDKRNHAATRLGLLRKVKEILEASGELPGGFFGIEDLLVTAAGTKK